MYGISTDRKAAPPASSVVVVVLIAIGCSTSNKAPICPPGSLLATCHETCESDGDCLAPARCEVGTHTCQRPVLACDPLAGDDSNPTGSDGVCPAAQVCDLVTATCAPRPGAACMTSGDCRAGEVCGSSTCIPAGDSAACQRDGDCSAPNVCRLVLDPSNTRLLSVCGPPIGPAESGARCRESGECQSGLCLRSGVCFGGCRPGSDSSMNTDCHNHDGVICGETVLSFPSAGATPLRFTVTSCVLLPPTCQSDRDCDTSGGACQIIVDPKKPTQLRTGCLPAAGRLRASAPCEQDGDCASGLCSGSGTSRVCFAACRGVGDCRPAPPLVCRSTAYQVDGISGSIASCVPGP
jgi:hypothetical protein